MYQEHITLLALSKHYNVTLLCPTKLTLHDQEIAINYFSEFNVKVMCVQKGEVGFSKKLFTMISPFGMPLAIKFNYTSELRRKFMGIINKIDVIHIETLYAYWSFLFKYNVKPIILRQHNCETDFHQQFIDSQSSGIKKLLFKIDFYKVKKYEELALRNSKGILFTSRRDLKLSNQFKINANDCYILPLSMRLDENQNYNNLDKYDLVFVGTLGEQTFNEISIIHFIEKIYPIINKTLPSTSVAIVGRGPSENLKRIASKYPNINITGEVSTISTFLYSSKVFIAPLLYGGGIKQKVLEAMIAGLPIVGYPRAFDGIDIIDGKEAYYTKDPDTFAKKVLFLLVNDDRRIEMGEYAKEFYKSNFEEGKFQKNILEIYNNIIRNE